MKDDLFFRKGFLIFYSFFSIQYTQSLPENGEENLIFKYFLKNSFDFYITQARNTVPALRLCSWIVV